MGFNEDLKGEKSIIYVSNSLAEIEQAHDRILVSNEGKILMDGNLDVIRKHIRLSSISN